MARKIVITSGKGGVGKTTVAACLGMRLSLMGKRTAVIDVDFGLNNLDILLGAEDKTAFGVEDVITGKCRAKQALIEINRNLYIMPSSKKASTNLSAQNVKLLAEGLAKSFEFVFLDCPAGVSAGFERAVASVEEAIVVVNPSLSSLRDADKAISIMKSYGLEKIWVIVNRARGDLMAQKLTLSPSEIIDILRLPLLGVLPDDDYLLLGDARRLPEYKISDKAYLFTAKKLLGTGSKIYDPTKPYKGLFGRMRLAFQRRG